MNYFHSDFTPFHRVENGFDVLEFHSWSDAVNLLRRHFDRNSAFNTGAFTHPRWAGIIGESGADYLENAGAKQALSDFHSAEPSVAIKPLAGSIAARPNGGAWIIPEMIQGSPLPSRVRMRDRLPPQDWRLHLSTSGSVQFGDIARTAVKASRAAWDYTLRGGVVNLSIRLENGYHKASKWGTAGLCLIIHPAIASDWEVAQACSVQAYRAVAISFACAMSGTENDSLTVSTRFATPDVAKIGAYTYLGYDTSHKEADDRELAKIGIE